MAASGRGSEAPTSSSSPLASRGDLAIGLGFFGFALAYFALTFSHTLELRDEGYILYNSARAAAGEVPHRDVFGVYGPGVFEVTGFVLRLFEGRILPVRVLLVVVKAIAVALTYWIARFAVPRGFASFGALLAIAYWGRLSPLLNIPYAVLYTVPLCLAGLLCLLHAQARESAVAHVAAGLFIGSGVLFKQSLATFNAYGMLLAILAVGMIEERTAERSGWSVRLGLLFWTAAGIVAVAPFLSMLTPRDYALHFLPIHLLMLLVAIAAIRRGAELSLGRVLRARVLPFAAGLAIAPGITAIAYAWWGSLGTLVFDMFVLPPSLTNYYVAAELPPRGLSALWLGIAGLILTGLLALRGTRGVAVALAVMAGVFGWTAFDALAGAPSAAGVELLEASVDPVAGVESAAISLVAFAAFLPWFLRPTRAAGPRALGSFVLLAFFHVTMSLQIFPRASVNVWLLQPALVPLLTATMFCCYQLGVSPRPGPYRQVAAAALAALLPVWLVAPVVLRVARESTGAPRRALDLPASDGLTLGLVEIRLIELGEFEELIAHLGTAEPRDAPLFMLTNQDMAYFSSGRHALFPEREAALFLLGWGMLPDRQIRELDEDAMIDRLSRTPQAVVVDRRDKASTRLRAGLPKLAGFIDSRFEVAAAIGRYRVLQQRRR